MSILKTDQILSWNSVDTGAECQCRLRIFQISLDRAVVIVSQIPNRPGRSVTDEVVTLMRVVCDRFGLSLNQTMWIEHYPVGYLKDDDVYEHISAAAGSVASQRISKSHLESILQQEI